MKRYVIGPSVTEMAILACMVIAIFCLGAAGTYASASTFTPVKGLALLEPVEPDQHEQIVRVHPLKKDAVLQGISTVNNQSVPSRADRLYFWSAGDTPATLAKNLGSVQIDWISLAAYNQFDPRKMPAAGTIIRVPAALLAQGTGPVATESIATTHAVPLNNLATNAITPRAKIRESDASVQQSTTQAGPKSHKGHKDRKLGAWSYADSTTQFSASDIELLSKAINETKTTDNQTTVTNIADARTTEIQASTVSEAQRLAERYDASMLPPEDIRLASLSSAENSVLDAPLGTPYTSGFDDSYVSRNVDMFTGEARVFGKVNVERVAVGNGGVLRAEVLANGDLLAIALAAGSSSMHLWHKDGSRSDFNTRVSAEDPEVRVKLEKSIRMRVKMIEFRRSELKRLGIDWGDSIDGPVFATAGDLISNSLFRPDSGALGANLPLAVQPFSSFLGITAQLSSRINFLVANGDAEMLAEPVLSCRNGGSASFLAGGEVPYPTVGANGQTNIEFREYGIRLEISPVADQNGTIQASILTEVSSIDPAVTVLGAPGLLTRRTQTQVSVIAGDTIVIGGLLQSESGKDIDSLPGIGKLPVLGKLFRSDNMRNNVSELVIFITPDIIDPSRPSLNQAEFDTNLYAQERLKQQAALLERLRKQ